MRISGVGPRLWQMSRAGRDGPALSARPRQLQVEKVRLSLLNSLNFLDTWKGQVRAAGDIRKSGRMFLYLQQRP